MCSHLCISFGGNSNIIIPTGFLAHNLPTACVNLLFAHRVRCLFIVVMCRTNTGVNKSVTIHPVFVQHITTMNKHLTRWANNKFTHAVGKSCARRPVKVLMLEFPPKLMHRCEHTAYPQCSICPCTSIPRVYANYLSIPIYHILWITVC